MSKSTMSQVLRSIPGAVWVLILAGALIGVQLLVDDPLYWQLAAVVVMLLAKALGVNFDEVQDMVEELGGEEVVVMGVSTKALPTRPEGDLRPLATIADDMPVVKTSLPGRMQRFWLG